MPGRRRFGLFLPWSCRRPEIRGARNTKGGDEFSHRTSSAGIALALDLVPQFGRIVTTLAPSATEKLLESIDARRSSVWSRPFRVPAGAQETPDGLTLDMQRETDGLLTHSLAVQSNYFVVPINPALATILAILLEPALGLRRTVSRWRRRFDHHGHNCFRQGGALLLQDPLDSGGQIAKQVETVGHLNSLRRTTGGCLLYTSDAADDLLCVDLG